MFVPTQHSVGAGGSDIVIPFVAVSLAPSEETTTKIICLPKFYIETFKDRYEDLEFRAKWEFFEKKKLECKSISRDRAALSEELTAGLEDLFDDMFFLKSGEFEFRIDVYGAKNKLIASASSKMKVSSNQISRLEGARADLKYGFRTACQASPAAHATFPLISIAG
ncbi:hypothetical protein E3C22_18320 [Jiella endophytica]|uniref:Uncharacterized protein n=1 Tax=Jiella endophytica TaxID=2558362 RepID=A0A4Y8RGJ4_9HYPH|nr:hypothetical protein [Jiella endophytica]TFF20843.1 hypothetical protein E3C22_18320 [Jiella endophytica]